MRPFGEGFLVDLRDAQERLRQENARKWEAVQAQIAAVVQAWAKEAANGPTLEAPPRPPSS